MTLENWLLFSSIALVATITPGPAVLLVSGHSIGYGTGRAVSTILGNITGLFTMSLLSVVGLSAVVLVSAHGLIVLKLAGALYLIYLGVRLWRHGFSFAAAGDGRTSCPPTARRLRLFGQGIMVALSNPKAIAFTTALFPQFIEHHKPLFPQFMLLVATFMIYSFICLLFYAALAAKTGAGIKSSPSKKIASRIFASLFIGSGLSLAAAT